MSRPDRANDRKYRHALRRHEHDLLRATQSAERRLRDPAHNTNVGLPDDLPDSTIAILAQTIALDKVGPKRPRRDRWT